MSYYLMYGRNLTKLKANAMFPLQYSCLENPMGGEAWWAAVYGVAQSRTQLKQLSNSSIIRYYGDGDSISTSS